MADGPVLEDPGVIAQRMMGGANNNPGQPKKDDILESSSTFFERIFGIKNASIFGTGIFAQFTPPQQAFLGKSINQGAASLTSRGGAAANFAMESLRIATINKFDKLAKPAIENPAIGGGFPVQSMSYASLGTLTPSSGGGGRGGIQLG